MKKDTAKRARAEKDLEDQAPGQAPDQCRQIAESGSVTTRVGGHTIHCLTIIGQIEGHYILPSQNKTTKYEHVIPQIVAVEEDPQIDGLLVLLNTVGGDVEAGLALAELVAGMKKPTVSLVLGGGHSIGVPLAVAAKRSFIAESASMTIHPVRMNGLVLGIPQTLEYFQRMQDRITNFVVQNSPHQPGTLHHPGHEHPGAGDGRGHGPGRPRRGGGGAHRLAGLPVRRHGLPDRHDRPGEEKTQQTGAAAETGQMTRPAAPPLHRRNL